MKKAITIIFSLIGLVFVSTKIEASEIIDNQLSTVTNLTGYTWVGNDSINDFPDLALTINFTSNSINYTSFEISSPAIYYDDITVYDGTSWTDSIYSSVLFTGGNDVTNATFISWLEENGTLTEPDTSVNIISSIIQTITQWLTGFWTFIKATIESAIGLFYNTTDGLTVIGILALFGLAIGLVYFGLSFVMRFFKK